MRNPAVHRKGCACKPCRKWWRLLKHETLTEKANQQQYATTVNGLGDLRVLFAIPKKPPTPFTRIVYRRQA